ncbi:uncharacterized protein [Cardiocondyla obscurior]|uniref:uncharacterized protein n=1 Tax=Cardiocondyla obscurior TaxID=286306 RepID=UPI0039656761
MSYSRKNFKNLSVSQKNRRLCKVCERLEESNCKMMHLLCDSKNSEKNITLFKCISDDRVDNIYYSDVNSEENFCSKDDNDELMIHDITEHNDRSNYNFKEQLKKWVCDYNITHRATGALLKLLKNVKDTNELTITNFPLDPRTLLNTSQHIITREVSPGKYFYYVLDNALIDILKTAQLNTVPKDIIININNIFLILIRSQIAGLFKISYI